MTILSKISLYNSISLRSLNEQVIIQISHEIFMLYAIVMIHTFLEELPKAFYDVCIQSS